MHFQSRWKVPIPDIHLASYVFESPSRDLSRTERCLLDADNPDARFFTTHDFRLWSQRFAAGLRKAGIQPGDRVLFFSGNDLFYMVVFFGIIMAGGIFTGANPTYLPRELAYQLEDSGAKFLICAEGSLDTGLAAAEQAGLGRDQVFVFNGDIYTGNGEGKRGCRHWGDLVASEIEGRKFAWDPLDSGNRAADTILALNYSSGTTGKPKGVEITHKNYVANCLQVRYVALLDPDIEKKDRNARWLGFLPLYHAYGQTYAVAAVHRRIPLYLMPRFDFVKMLQHVERYRISSLSLVPPIVVALAKHPDVKKYDLTSIQAVTCGAAPLGRETCQEAEAVWKGAINIRQGWGMTEVTCSFMIFPDGTVSKTSAVGELLPNCEAKIMAEDGVSELGRNQRGELWVRGPNVMKGYWRNPEATRDTKTVDGWLKTGDIAYVDSEGRFYVVDRKKELIKVKGNQVAPAELEAQLLEHPAVADAAVIGLEINMEEYPRAYIVLKPGKTASEKDIIDFMKQRVAPVKRITGGVVFRESIPKNPSGKILRRQLREMAKEEVGVNGIAAKL
ncbi:hypothetical protein Plec18170_007076 [Paecilomyces lecythidis]